MRSLRSNAHLSLRTASERSGVDRNTILRVEKGLPCRDQTRAVLCATYGVFNVHPSQVKVRQDGVGYAVHRAELAWWHRTRVAEATAPSEISSSEEMQEPAERNRQGIYGLANQFFTKLECDREAGSLKAALLEVYGTSGISQQVSGEAFVFVVKGQLTFTIGADSFELGEGEAATFDRTVPHMHAPASTMNRTTLPAILLYVQSS